MANKKKKKKWILPVIIIGILAVVIYLGATAIRESRQVLSDAQTRTAATGRGDIELTVAGSGSLTADDSVDVMVPSILPIDEMQVELGDTVKAGDVLATLDPVELQNAISQVQEEIAAIDEKIDEAEAGTEESEINATAGGRVKEIAVAEGGSIASAMTQKGYLVVLSLDGSMRVDVESGANPEEGSSVTVVLPDGSEEDGEVSSSGASAFSVTLTDNGPVPGETVSVLDENGESLGTGVLEVSAPLNIVGSDGTVKSIDVEVDDKVEKGDSLITLRDTVAVKQYQELSGERTNYENLLRVLLTYAETNTIVAETDGSITEIQAGQSSAASDGSSQLDMGSILDNLPIAADGNGEGITFDTLAHVPAKEDAGTGMQMLAEQQPTVTEIVGVVDVPVTAPALGGTPQAVIIPGIGYTGTIAWEPTATFFGPQTSYTAVIILQAVPGFRFADDVQATVAGANIEGLAVSAEAERNTVSFRAVFPPTAALPANTDMEQYINDILQNSIGDAVSGLGDISGSLGNIGGSFSIDGSSLGQGSSTASVSTAMAALCTITPGKEYSLVAEIDEIDIFSIELGQTAKIVMDAMLDDVFLGEVTKISTVGTSQSGVTTYPVTIRLDVVDTPLLGGMNATANIVTEVRENVLKVPLEALQENGDETFVYLYNPQWQAPQSSDELGEVRVVETGISDGVDVEIVSGLSDGDEVIYTVIETNAFLEAIMSMSGSGGMSQGDGTTDTAS